MFGKKKKKKKKTEDKKMVKTQMWRHTGGQLDKALIDELYFTKIL